MIREVYEIKRNCDNPKFVVIVAVQGQMFCYRYSTLFGALVGYAKQYLKKHKDGTMNFTLRTRV